MTIEQRNAALRAFQDSRNAISTRKAPTMLLLPAPNLLSCRIPFCGFYESLYSGELGRHEESEADYLAGEDGTPLSETLGDLCPDLVRIAPALPEGKLKETIAEAFWKAANYQAMNEHLAKAYAEEFISWLSDSLALDVAGEFEEMTSPRYYNFETDRIFAGISEGAIREVARRLHEEKPEALPETFRAMFTSRDGFISSYDNAVPERDLAEWDHNELYALLEAWCDHQLDGGDISHELYDWSIGGLYEEVYRAFDAGMDWDALKERLAEDAVELIDEFDIEVEELPYRCPHTLELPFA